MDSGIKHGDLPLVPYGYGRVTGPEKRRLVLHHFDQIAARYDLADALLSFGLHFLWRRSAIHRLGLDRAATLLDLCGGTGDFAAMVSGDRAFIGLSVVCDMNRPMLESGRRKKDRSPPKRRIHWVQGDAEELGFPDGSFDAVTVGFGVRNLVALERGLEEMFRVLRKNGKLMIMEFSLPVTPWFRALYHWYSFRVMPLFGRVVTGKKDPFVYLAESVRTFPSPEDMASRLERTGFRDVRFERLTDGVVVLYIGKK